MANQKSFRKRHLPPCPDPGSYILVRLKDNTFFWRRRRGSHKPATLNASFLQNAELTKLLSPLVVHLTHHLATCLDGHQLPNIHTSLLTGIKKHYKQYNCIGYEQLRGMEILQAYPLSRLFAGTINSHAIRNGVYLQLGLRQHSIIKTNKLVTDFYFEAIMISGCLSAPHTLGIQSEQSELFSFYSNYEREVSFQFQLTPGKPWMLLLKIACFEGEQKAAHIKNYSMKIIDTG